MPASCEHQAPRTAARGQASLGAGGTWGGREPGPARGHQRPRKQPLPPKGHPGRRPMSFQETKSGMAQAFMKSLEMSG